MEQPQKLEPLQRFHDQAVRVLNETLTATPELEGINLNDRIVSKAAPAYLNMNLGDRSQNAILVDPELPPGWGLGDHEEIDNYLLTQEYFFSGRSVQSFIVDLKDGGRILFFNIANKKVLAPEFGLAESLRKYGITELVEVSGAAEAGYGCIRYGRDFDQLLKALRKMRSRYDPVLARWERDLLAAQNRKLRQESGSE